MQTIQHDSGKARTVRFWPDTGFIDRIIKISSQTAWPRPGVGASALLQLESSGHGARVLNNCLPPSGGPTPKDGPVPTTPCLLSSCTTNKYEPTHACICNLNRCTRARSQYIIIISIADQPMMPFNDMDGQQPPPAAADECLAMGGGWHTLGQRRTSVP